VDELYEAWDFQRKYGTSAARAADGDSAEASERPPPFKAFIPTKTRMARSPATPSTEPGCAVWKAHACQRCFDLCDMQLQQFLGQPSALYHSQILM
jgi:hypothetical protein